MKIAKLFQSPGLIPAILFFAAAMFPTGAIEAQQTVFETGLTKFDPKTQTAKLYHSFRHGKVLLALENKHAGGFSCEPNDYFVYDYIGDRLKHFRLASLVLNNTFDRGFALSIKKIRPYRAEDASAVKKDLIGFMNELRVSGATLKHNAVRSKADGSVCWIQAGVMNSEDGEIEKLPFLAANFCEGAWCPDVYWKDRDNLKFWVRLHPKKTQLIGFNSESLETRIIETRNGLKIGKRKIIENAPRQNLMNEKLFAQGSYRITHERDTSLTWKKVDASTYQFTLLQSDSAEGDGRVSLLLN